MASIQDKDRYSSNGIDLLEPPVLNLNPFDILFIAHYILFTFSS